MAQLLVKYSFLNYAAGSWARHIRAASIPGNHSSIDFCLELCDIGCHRYMVWPLVEYRTQWYITGVNNIFLASCLDLVAVVKRLLATSRAESDLIDM